ncbi:MAG TPA: hypothetical protein VFQ44_02685 [Streptosporangiaceae bacterium]|nr:hypothetical protein [Streptosporangiaceae bacterium]
MEFRNAFGRVFAIEATAAGAIFLLVCLTVAAAMVVSRRRRRKDTGPSGRSEHNPLEAGYLAAVTVAAAALIALSLGSNSAETSDPPARPAVTVRVTAFQWCWRFSYAGHPVTVTAQCAGKAVPTLVLPAREPVRIEVTARDVIHSFWVPYLRFKVDAFPGHVNSFMVKVPRPGRWAGRCAQFCGVFHFQMEFYVRAVPKAAFGRWLRKQARA